MDEISRRLQEKLKERGWSQRELSRRAGLDEKHVGKIIHRGGAYSSAATLRALADAADVSVAWLITGLNAPTLHGARTLREAMQMTADDLALRSGLSLSTIESIESSKVPVPQEVILNLAKGFGIQPERLQSYLAGGMDLASVLLGAAPPGATTTLAGETVRYSKAGTMATTVASSQFDYERHMPQDLMAVDALLNRADYNGLEVRELVLVARQLLDACAFLRGTRGGSPNTETITVMACHDLLTRLQSLHGQLERVGQAPEESGAFDVPDLNKPGYAGDETEALRASFRKRPKR